ncbi:site-specific integrase [Nonomuraea sp. MTCD27]|uniref:site-specific integrase n=1 Tax=Nonomuraea sp. MTCD27 TaxID=1676747 RepID=UPI0035BFC6A7
MDGRTVGRLPARRAGGFVVRFVVAGGWWLVALRGLPRGEVAGPRWVDVDLERRELTVAHQLVHTDEGLVWCEPKSAASRRTLALDPETVRLLRQHERAQRQLPGEWWSPTGPIFTLGSGAPVQPSYLTHRLHKLVSASGLPPVRLHDLRHGAATLALASGTELKVVQGTLGHASIVLTADTYVSVLPQLYHDSARATARLVLRAGRATNRKIGKAGRRRDSHAAHRDSRSDDATTDPGKAAGRRGRPGGT